MVPMVTMGMVPIIAPSCMVMVPMIWPIMGMVPMGKGSQNRMARLLPYARAGIHPAVNNSILRGKPTNKRD